MSFQHGFVIVCIARSAAGLAGGFLCAIYSAFLANTKSPGKVIAVTTFIQIGIEALFVFCAATVFHRLGSDGLFILMTALSVVLVPLLGILPRGWPEGDRSDADKPFEFLRSEPVIGYMLAPGVCSIHYGANRRVHFLGRIRPPSGTPFRRTIAAHYRHQCGVQFPWLSRGICC